MFGLDVGHNITCFHKKLFESSNITNISVGINYNYLISVLEQQQQISAEQSDIEESEDEEAGDDDSEPPDTADHDNTDQEDVKDRLRQRYYEEKTVYFLNPLCLDH